MQTLPTQLAYIGACKAAQVCRCCGEPMRYIDGQPIHTACIVRHWGKHHQHINSSQCKEFGGASS